MSQEDHSAAASPLAPATAPNHSLFADFVNEKLADARAFQILTVIDQFTRECVWLEADQSMNGVRMSFWNTTGIQRTARGPQPRAAR